MKRAKLIHKPIVSLLLIVLLFISGCSNKQPEINNIISNEQWAFENNGNKVNEKHATADMDINYPEQSIYDFVDYEELPLIAIIDTGIDFGNPYLSTSVYTNVQETLDGIDNDSNGYIDDIYGVDIENQTGISSREVPSDYHGSFIAQIIGGFSDKHNYKSVLPKCKILQIKVSAKGEKIAVHNIIKGVRYAEEQGAKVINCSFELAKENNELFNIMKNSKSLFICSAGNSSVNELTYPAAYNLDNVVAVASMNALGAITLSSNYGEWVDIAAPGDEVLVYDKNLNKTYVSGSSFANAFVAATATMVWSFDELLKPEDVKKILLENSRSNYLLEKEEIKCNMLDISLILDFCTKKYS